MTTIVPAWFSRVGLPFETHEEARIAAMLAGLDFAAGLEPAGTSSWWEVAQVLRADETDNRRWDAEEAERERLWSLAAERWTEDDLLARLTAFTAPLGDPVRNAAGTIAARMGVADPGLVRAAADAALLAAHQHVLADLSAAADGHYFRCKFELFAAGRWPVGVLSGRFIVF